ncbi:AAA family ATPase [Bradyrhizobium sp. IC3195]|uniref:AAA family ATPase n=1 Tax=Bradyrhizobium sp. IC3195 TaxID=2793804 RepID=UPI001CD4AC8E|nr:AAA family ATPase [Bradyrhizobium sp. IC3195]MCA1469795.1 AAA family ATPase [Bradyrhizobium sp. IC3195]
MAEAILLPSEVRKKLRTAGFSPLPIVGKRPPMEKWETKHDVNVDEIMLWDQIYPSARSTGILTSLAPTLDIDILNEEAAEAVEDLVRKRYEDRGRVLVRIGRAPKRAIPFRTERPFKKIEAKLIAPNGETAEKIELLADGQQVLCFGSHPETNRPYLWFGGQPGDIRRDELPCLAEGEARQLVNDSADLLVRDFGYERVAPRPKPIGGDVDADGASDWQSLFRDILSGCGLHDALRNLAAKMIRAGATSGAVCNQLRALMHASSASRDERWRARYDEIPRLVQSAEKYREHADTETGEKSVGLGEWNAGKDVMPPPPREWLLGNSFCRKYVSSVLADGGTGKTALRVAQGLALATGRPLTGEHVFQRCRVLIVSLEDDREELRRRVLAARLHYNIQPSEVEGWLYLAAPGRQAGKLKIMNARGQTEDGQLKANLEAAIRTNAIDCVIIDPLVKTHGVEENSNSAIDDVAQALTDLAIGYNIAVDVPHHTSKGSDKPGDAHRGRGASALIDAARLTYTLTVMGELDAQTFGIPVNERRRYIRLDRAKVNTAPASGPATWFKLVGVNLANGSDLYPNGDEVQTVELWTPPETWAGMDNALLNRILTEINDGMPDKTLYSAAPNARARAAWKVICRAAPEKTEEQAREMIQTWLKTGVLIECEYYNEVARKSATGLYVDDAKRPGTTCSFDQI